VIRQGEPGDYYYIIQSGRCEVTRRTSAASQDIKLAELSAGDSFGEEALLSDKPRNATITMLTSGNLMRLTKQAFDELIKRPALNGVSYEQAQQMAAKGAIWLDVRFPDEHKDLVISKSENIPLYVLRMEIGRLPQDKSYIVFCDSGTRSSVGAFLLTQRGFDVYYLEGGIINSPIASKLESASIPPAEEHPEAVLPPSASEANTETATTLSKTVEKTPDTSISLPSPKTAAFISALKKEVIKTRLQLKQALKLKTEAQESKRFIVRKLK
ncbi:MAG: cyclic nucleotide-binding domain-containing protein, partial [Gammaproteobacteria bacterium]|nr:cyclic nucleotide-binding domain-containing protein [Gammaproteobacteria bacterium]